MPNQRYAWNQFSPSGVPFASHQNLGDSNRYGKNFRGFCSQYIFRKIRGSVQKIPSSFGAVVRKPGLGGKLPPTCNTRVNVRFGQKETLKMVWRKSIHFWRSYQRKRFLINFIHRKKHSIATLKITNNTPRHTHRKKKRSHNIIASTCQQQWTTLLPLTNLAQ